MPKKIVLLALLLLPLLAFSQQESAPKDSIILRRFFHAIGRCIKNTKVRLQPLTNSLNQQYHNTPNSLNTINRRFAIEIIAGSNFNWQGKKYTPFDTSDAYTWKYDRSIFYGRGGSVGYTFIPQVGFHAGLNTSFQITRAFSIEYGLIYYSSRAKWKMDSDTIQRNMVNAFNIKYNAWPDLRNEISVNDQYFEMPVYFGYNIDRFYVIFGAKIILLRVMKVYRSYVSTYPDNTSSYFYPIFNHSWQIKDMSYPSFKLKYLLNKKKIPISVYLSTERFYRKAWDFQAGVQVRFYSI